MPMPGVRPFLSSPVKWSADPMFVIITFSCAPPCKLARQRHRAANLLWRCRSKEAECFRSSYVPAIRHQNLENPCPSSLGSPRLDSIAGKAPQGLAAGGATPAPLYPAYSGRGRLSRLAQQKRGFQSCLFAPFYTQLTRPANSKKPRRDCNTQDRSILLGDLAGPNVSVSPRRPCYTARTTQHTTANPMLQIFLIVSSSGRNRDRQRLLGSFGFALPILYLGNRRELRAGNPSDSGLFPEQSSPSGDNEAETNSTPTARVGRTN